MSALQAVAKRLAAERAAALAKNAGKPKVFSYADGSMNWEKTLPKEARVALEPLTPEQIAKGEVQRAKDAARHKINNDRAKAKQKKNLTPKQKAQIKWRAGLSPERKQEYRDKNAKLGKEAYKNISPEKKRVLADRSAEAYRKMTPAQKLRKNAKQKARRAARKAAQL